MGVPRGAVRTDGSFGSNSKFRAGISVLGLEYVAAIVPTVKVRRVSHLSAKQLAPRLSAKQLALVCRNMLGAPSPGARERTSGCARALPAFGCAPRPSEAPQHGRKKRC